MPLPELVCSTCSTRRSEFGTPAVALTPCGCPYDTVGFLDCPVCAKNGVPCQCHAHKFMAVFCENCTQPHVLADGAWRRPTTDEFMILVGHPQLQAFTLSQMKHGMNLRAQRRKAAACN